MQDKLTGCPVVSHLMGPRNKHVLRHVRRNISFFVAEYS